MKPKRDEQKGRILTRESELLNQMCLILSWNPSHAQANSKWTPSLAIKSHLLLTEGVDIQNALREPKIDQAYNVPM